MAESTTSLVSTPRRACLEDYFPSSTTISQFTDADCQEISRLLLEDHEKEFSTVPRLYTVLRMIGQVPVLRKFISLGYNDLWFPFERRALPRALSPSYQEKFLEVQNKVITKGLALENENKKHVVFLKGEMIPLIEKGAIAKGAYGFVDRVQSPLSHRELARKRFPRRGFPTSQLKSFATELQVLRRIHHHHCVELIASYTDPKVFGILMLPVAQCNLEEFYTKVPHDEIYSSSLRKFFGCLASALSYLHEIKIRHRDIKPANILIKGANVYLADFGISLDWQNRSRGTTEIDSTKSLPYCAPEVAKYAKRNESSDVFSLGCVFVEMLTVLSGRTVQHLRSMFLERTGTIFFSEHVISVREWIYGLDISTVDRPVLDWIDRTVALYPEARVMSAELHSLILNSDPLHPFHCESCVSEGDSSSGISDDEDVLSDEKEETKTDLSSVASATISHSNQASLADVFMSAVTGKPLDVAETLEADKSLSDFEFRLADNEQRDTRYVTPSQRPKPYSISSEPAQSVQKGKFKLTARPFHSRATSLGTAQATESIPLGSPSSRLESNLYYSRQLSVDHVARGSDFTETASLSSENLGKSLSSVDFESKHPMGNPNTGLQNRNEERAVILNQDGISSIDEEKAVISPATLNSSSKPSLQHQADSGMENPHILPKEWATPETLIRALHREWSRIARSVSIPSAIADTFLSNPHGVLPEILALAIEAGLDFDAGVAPNDGQRPLHFLARHFQDWAQVTQELATLTKMTKVLFNHSDIDAEDVSGDTALWWAVEGNHTSLVKELLDNGANPNASRTHVLCCASSEAILQELIGVATFGQPEKRRIIQVNSTNTSRELTNSGKTLASWAVDISGPQEARLLDLLIAYGAQLGQEIVFSGLRNTFRFNYMEVFNPFVNALWKPQKEVLCVLVKHRLHLSKFLDSDTKGCMMYESLKHGSLEKVEMLLEANLFDATSVSSWRIKNCQKLWKLARRRIDFYQVKRMLEAAGFVDPTPGKGHIFWAWIPPPRP